MEEEATSKERELSGISRALFPDEDSDEEDHESVQVIERATRLVDDLQTEKSTSEAVQRDLELARQELARLQDSLQKAEEQLVEKLDEGLSRLKDLELELGEKDATIAALTEELEQSQERADTNISELKQSAADESLRHQDEIDAVKSEMDTRISELEAKHAKVCEELEARIAQRDESIEKVRITRIFLLVVNCVPAFFLFIRHTRLSSIFRFFSFSPFHPPRSALQTALWSNARRWNRNTKKWRCPLPRIPSATNRQVIRLFLCRAKRAGWNVSCVQPKSRPRPISLRCGR